MLGSLHIAVQSNHHRDFCTSGFKKLHSWHNQQVCADGEQPYAQDFLICIFFYLTFHIGEERKREGREMYAELAAISSVSGNARCPHAYLHRQHVRVLPVVLHSDCKSLFLYDSTSKWKFTYE